MAKWDTAYVNRLPDSSFAWISSDGQRHLPYKDKDGNVDLPHVRNALARLNQVKGMPAGTQKAVREKLQRILNRSRSMSEVTYLVDATKLEIADDNTTTFQAFPYGSWDHALYGEVTMDESIAKEMIKNFSDNVYGQDLHIDYAHKRDASKGDMAAGWIKNITMDASGLNYVVEFTQRAISEIRNKEWRYFSPEFYQFWENPVTGIQHQNVVTGGGLTNRPFLKGIAPLNFDEADEWSKADPGTNTPEEPGPNPLFPDGYNIRVIAPGASNNNPNDNVKNNLSEVDVQVWDGDTLVTTKSATFYTQGKKVTNVDEAAIRTLLNLSENDDLEAALRTLSEKAQKFSDLEAIDKKRRDFATDFPEEAERMKKLEEIAVKAEIDSFTKKFTEPDEKGNVFGSVVTEKLEEVYTNLDPAGRKALAETLELVRSSGGVVQFTEIGSTNGGEIDEGLEGIDKNLNAGQKLVAVANKLMESDKIPFDAAIKLAAEKHPALAKEYAGTYHRPSVDDDDE